MRWAAVGLSALAALALITLAGCATSPRPAAQPTADHGALAFLREERPYLLSPAAGYPLVADSRRQGEVEAAFRSLVEEGDTEAALALARRQLEVDPRFHPAVVLAAQAEYVSRRLEAARGRLRVVVDELPEYTAAQLLWGRVAEKLGDVPAAYAAYRASADSREVAARRAEELLERALEIMANRADDALARGRLELAEQSLARLESWAPEADVTLEVSRRVAAVRGDLESELAAVAELARRQPENREVVKRNAELELEVGDASRGLQLYQRLALQYPDDLDLAEQLEVAKFRWRLQLLPEEVQALVAQTELTRADFATLLYWLVPEVRAARPESVRIATDILDHPQREAIARVANLGLMEVDPTLHHFSPQEPVQRITALSALLSVLVTVPAGPPACIGSAGVGRSWESLCSTAARCLILDDAADCLPLSGLSGQEAVELIRRTLKHQ